MSTGNDRVRRNNKRYRSLVKVVHDRIQQKRDNTAYFGVPRLVVSNRGTP